MWPVHFVWKWRITFGPSEKFRQKRLQIPTVLWNISFILLTRLRSVQKSDNNFHRFCCCFTLSFTRLTNTRTRHLSVLRPKRFNRLCLTLLTLMPRIGKMRQQQQKTTTKCAKIQIRTGITIGGVEGGSVTWFLEARYWRKKMQIFVAL